MQGINGAALRAAYDQGGVTLGDIVRVVGVRYLVKSNGYVHLSRLTPEGRGNVLSLEGIGNEPWSVTR